VLARVAKRQPDLLDGGVQAVLEVHVQVIRPQPPAQLFPRHQLAGALQEQGQDLERLLLQPEAGPVAPDDLRLKARLERPEANEKSVGVSRPGAGRRLRLP
jgi:hypothetical protein